MPTNLSLEVSPNLDSRVMRIFDTSSYGDNKIENYLIEVLPVNRSEWVNFLVSKKFSLVLNSSNLRYAAASDVSKLIDLPDGVYEIRQSYKPNTHTVAQYYHLRTVELVKKIKKEWSDLILDTCKISREEFIKNRDKLREVDEYAMAAKFMVEECHKKKEGIETYQFASKLLQEYTNECGC